MSRKIAIAGSTGLIGKTLLKLSLEDDEISKIYLLHRRAVDIKHPKVENILIDYLNKDSFPKLKPEEVYICLGTTMKKAGGKEAFRSVDYSAVVNTAHWAQDTGVKKVAVISSIGARENTSNFYLRTKGEMELALSEMNFKELLILRPSLLLGDRDEFRFGESAAKLFTPFFIGPLKKYAPVKAISVARTMLHYQQSEPVGKTIIENTDILKY